VFLAVYDRFDRLGQSEPDLYFQLAIAKKTAEEGIVRKLPQAENIGWAESFPDKNFLFTYLSGVSYRIGGEQGTLSLVPILSGMILVFLFLFLKDYRPTPLAALLGVVPLLLTPGFTNRLVLMRPK